MAQKRNVKRSGNSGRQAVIKAYSEESWYDLPFWARDWLVAHSWWIILGFAVILTPAALLAVVLGAHSLPLDYIGIPVVPSDNGVGVAALTFMAEFILLVLAVKPLKNQRRRGWVYVLAAAMLQAVHGISLRHGVTSVLLVVGTIYLYRQVRAKLN